MGRKFTLWNSLCLLVLCGYVAQAQVDVLTQHNDLGRTGWNNQETVLNTSNVDISVGTFGKLYSRQMDDEIFAQPLVVTGVTIGGSSKNIVIVATVNNSIYAWDADNSSVATPYWQINLTRAGQRPPQNTDITISCFGNNYRDFPGKFGIVGTPVINKSTNTMYVVARSTDGTNFHDDLHAIDIRTGADIVTKIEIQATVNGTGDGGSTVSFNPLHQNQRPGLVLSNGIVYVGFASHCDWIPYHGWLLGYDANTLQQKIIFCSTPNGQGGGIWGTGAAPAVDALGNIYLATGNGDAGTTISDPNKGETAMQLTPNLGNGTFTISSFFLPFNFGNLDGSDLDLGVTESLLIPGTQNVITGCKNGNMYFMNGNSMGGYTNGGPDANLQTISLGQSASQHASYAYYNNGSGNEYVYVLSEASALKAFPYNRGSSSFGSPTISGIQGPAGQSGAFLSVSSNGSTAGTGILWAAHAIAPCDANTAPANGLCQGILRALDANDVTKELWNSSDNINDTLGLYAKFVCPTVANGKVYMVTFSGKLVVYGITGVTPCPGIPNVADFHNNASATYSASSNTSTAVNAFDGNLSTAWVGENSDGFSSVQNITVNLGSVYNLCKVVVNWGSVYSPQYTIQGSNDNNTYTTIASISDNSSLLNVFYLPGQSWQYIRMQAAGQSSFSSGLTIDEMQVYATPSNGCISPTNVASSNITQTTATYTWTPVTGATSYNFQYKTTAASTWTTISQSSTTVNLTGLACGTDYLVQVQAVCGGGNSAFTPSAFSTSACTVSCTLPTRWTSLDIGSTAIAGSACLNGAIYTLQGSGADIGGTADAFHFAYFNLGSDETIIATVETQDATNPNNKAGIMIRANTNPNAPFAFIGLTSGNGAVFETRNSTGGTAVTSFTGGIAAPYWIKLVKSGSSYSGFISPDGNTWTQVGNTTDAGFGSGTSVFAGLAITSDNNTVLSTATIDNFTEQTNPLAIKLSDFSAQNVNNQYVQLSWITSSEVNNNYFVVQRSIDGTHFSDLLNVPGAGNSSIAVTYSAQDPHPVQGINYYRLKAVDFSGKYSYSAVILVRFGQLVGPIIYPNPARSYFAIVAGQDQIKTVSVYDVTGKVMKKVSNSSGASVLTVYCNDFAPGVYLVQISTTTQNYIRKLIRQ